MYTNFGKCFTIDLLKTSVLDLATVDSRPANSICRHRKSWQQLAQRWREVC